MSQYSGDPRFISAKFESNCNKPECGALIRKNDKVFYYPNGRKIFCPKCSVKISAEFEAAVADEAFMSGANF